MDFDTHLDTHLDTLETPAALVDLAVVQHNIARMQSRITRLGARLRPHVKTAKCIELAALQREAGASGITVSTLKEADVFFEAGFDDILYAVGMPPGKLDHAFDLARRGCRLTVLVDSLAAAQALVRRGAQGGPAPAVMIEVDTDGHRAGVDPQGELLLQLGRALHEGGLRMAGVMAHAGASYEESTPQGLQRIAEQERARCVLAAQRLRSAGLPCPEVSVGSTPTALSATSLQGVTEVRAGVYVFHDLVMCNVGVCTPAEVALSVLTTVIGHQADKGWILVDAGWMAMSRDRGTQAQAVDYGYGAVCDRHGRLLPGWIMSGANQEHGILSRPDGQGHADLAEAFPVGTRLRVLPNHACATAAQFGGYEVMHRDGSLARWPRFNGW